jgi:hypothetical protein
MSGDFEPLVAAGFVSVAAIDGEVEIAEVIRSPENRERVAHLRVGDGQVREIGLRRGLFIPEHMFQRPGQWLGAGGSSFWISTCGRARSRFMASSSASTV